MMHNPKAIGALALATAAALLATGHLGLALAGALAAAISFVAPRRNAA